MKYINLKESIIEILKNESILKNNLIMEYSLNRDEFNKLYMEFIEDVGGEIKYNLNSFDIVIDTDFVIKIITNENT